MAIQDRYLDVLAELAKKGYLIHAPMRAKGLWQDCPELNDVAEFKPLSSAELLMVWWFASRCSPIIEMPEEKRILVAIDQSFRSPAMAEARKIEYGTLSFTNDNIKAAIKRMDAFDPGGRITAMADDLHLLRQCQTVIRKDISKADMEEITEWMKAVSTARKLRDEILQRIERGSLGVADETTVSASLKGAAREYMKNKTN